MLWFCSLCTVVTFWQFDNIYYYTDYTVYKYISHTSQHFHNFRVTIIWSGDLRRKKKLENSQRRAVQNVRTVYRPQACSVWRYTLVSFISPCPHGIGKYLLLALLYRAVIHESDGTSVTVDQDSGLCDRRVLSRQRGPSLERCKYLHIHGIGSHA